MDVESRRRNARSEEKVQGFLCLSLIIHISIRQSIYCAMRCFTSYSCWMMEKSKSLKFDAAFQCSLKCKFRIQTSTTVDLFNWANSVRLAVKNNFLCLILLFFYFFRFISFSFFFCWFFFLNVSRVQTAAEMMSASSTDVSCWIINFQNTLNCWRSHFSHKISFSLVFTQRNSLSWVLGDEKSRRFLWSSICRRFDLLHKVSHESLVGLLFQDLKLFRNKHWKSLKL